jgi:hypothetical protein
MVMVPLNPHDLPSLLRIRETADAGEKIPVFAFKAPEVEVRKDVAEQDQLAEVHLTSEPRCKSERISVSQVDTMMATACIASIAGV